MLKNYYKIDENSSVETFLKEVNEKKNTQYLILKSNPESFVDIRTIALKAHNSQEKLKNLKKTISFFKGDKEIDYLNFLIESGERVIKTNEGYYDFLNALNTIKKENCPFLKKSLKESTRKEIFALNEKDTISIARNLMIKKRINILPIIDKLKLIGEIRNMNFLAKNLFNEISKEKRDSNFSKIPENILNLKITNLINKNPIIINNSKTYGEAIDLMLNKKLPSIIITNKNNLFSIISYKDIFKLFKKNSIISNYNIEYLGSENIYDDELDLIKDYSEKIMNKITKISNYNNLKVNFKSHGNNELSHKKKISINLLLSNGNNVIHIDKEFMNKSLNKENKIKSNWNLPQMAQNAFSALKKKVLDEKNKEI